MSLRGLKWPDHPRVTHGSTYCSRNHNSVSSAVFSDSTWLTCLKPRYITRISCLENLVCRSSSSRATGLVVCCLVRVLSKSNRASSGPGESGGVAICDQLNVSCPTKFFCFSIYQMFSSWFIQGHTTITSSLSIRYFALPSCLSFQFLIVKRRIEERVLDQCLKNDVFKLIQILIIF